MPNTGQAVVFAPRHYTYFDGNGFQEPPSSIREVPPEQLSESIQEINQHFAYLKQIDSKSSGLSSLAKILIALGFIVLVAIAIAVAVALTIGKTTSTSVNTTTTSVVTVFWSFDNNVLDLYGVYNGNASGSPSYTTSYIGTGAALSLTQASSQYVAITTPQLLFNSMSFTIEAWIYPIGLGTGDYGIFGQCQAASTNLCMFFIVRNYVLCCGFWNNTLLGSTSLTMSQWSHVACAFDLSTLTQQVYLNGVLDGSRSSAAYQGTSASTTIGLGYLTALGSNFFNGYFDQMQFTTRAKSATEILRDATLVVYYSFDSGSLYDNGPNGINASASGSPLTVTGRVNQALLFSLGDYISPSVAAFTMLGVSGQPYTFSIWANPTGAYTASAIILVGNGWCVSFITVTSSGNVYTNSWNGGAVPTSGPILVLNSWTHIGYTYSSTNGMRLYINGTLYSNSSIFTFSAAGIPVYVTIGSNRGQNNCSPGYGGGFTGALDECYLYSRELTASEISALANP